MLLLLLLALLIHSACLVCAFCPPMTGQVMVKRGNARVNGPSSGSTRCSRAVSVQGRTGGGEEEGEERPVGHDSGCNRKDMVIRSVASVSSVVALATGLPAVDFAAPLDVAAVTVQMEGKPLKIGDLLGKATLVVNVASYCALTPQYKDLVELDKLVAGKGLRILAFPCNQFGAQEPEEESVIRKDVKARFGVDFPIFDKVEVNGSGTCPLYVALKSYEPELSGYSKVNWNFEKFLLDASGKPVRRYRPGVLPTDTAFISDVSTLLAKGSLPAKKRKKSLNE